MPGVDERYTHRTLRKEEGSKKLQQREGEGLI